MKQYLTNLLKGVVIGSSMLVPGVSGGTMAIILGIYDRLVDAISNLFKNFKENVIFLSSVGIGGVIGLFLFARALEALLNAFEIPMTYFFIGACLASIPLLLTKSKSGKCDFKTFVYPLIGLAIVVGLSFLPQNGSFNFNGSFVDYMMMLLTGIIIALALVLPGISVSYMLLVLGIYNQFLTAVNSLDLAFLIPLFVSTLIGVFLTTKILDILMKKYPRMIYLVIIGFVLGSVYTIYPGLPNGWDILFSILLFISGFSGIYFVTKKFGTGEV